MEVYLPDWLVLLLAIAIPSYYLFGERLQEIFDALWVLARGFREDSKYRQKKQTLYVCICETDRFDSAGISELYRFCDETAEGTELNIEYFHLALLQYKYIVLLRERQDGTIRGMLALDIKINLELEGRRYNQIKMGSLVVRRNYRGSLIVLMMAVTIFFKCLLRHPFTPLYLMTKVFSYRSYANVTNMPTTYPRYDEETPSWEKRLLDDFGRQHASGEHKYNPETNVIEQTGVHLKDAVTDYSYAHINPHIDFFLKRNPHWKKGHCLVVASKITWISMFYFFYRGLLKRLFRRKKRQYTSSKITTSQASSSSEAVPEKPRKSERRLLRRLTTRAVLKDFYAASFLAAKEKQKLSLAADDEKPNNIDFDQVDLPSPM